MNNNLGQVVLVEDIRPGVFDINDSNRSQSSEPENLFAFDDRLYFAADNGETGRELFVSDGTTEETRLLADLNPALGNDVYDLDYSNSNPGNFIEFNDRLYFTADDNERGNELFVSDGTAEGTELLIDLYPGTSEYEERTGYSNSSRPNDFFEFGDRFYFTANNGDNGRELFVSDGTAEGTELLVDLNPGAENSSPENFFEFDNKLYFTADNGESGTELFVSDGTVEGTELLLDINPGSDREGENNSSNPSNFIEFDNKLYFAADDGESGRELFISDGTSEGTQLLVDLKQTLGNYDYSEYLGLGYSLGIPSSDPSDFVEFNDLLFFTAIEDGTAGDKLWVSDGTTEGTQLLANLRLEGVNDFGITYPYTNELVEFNDLLYFAADDGVNGRELYATDGTTEGTELVADINPRLRDSDGTGYGSNPSQLTVVGDELYFTADDGANGIELFKLTIDNDIPLAITGTEAADNLLGSDRAENIRGLSGNDTVDGNGGNDILLGGEGSDLLNAGNGNDSLTGAQGSDNLNGGNGNDTLFGNRNNDRLKGGNGNDFLNGGSSNDFLNGGAGNDTLIGGDGEDLFFLRDGEGTDTVIDFTLGSDRLGLAGGLQFDELSFSGDNILLGEEVLANLDGIDTEQLTPSDFMLV